MTISFARAPPDGVAPSATLCQHAGVALTRALESARFRMAEVSSLFVSVCHRPTLKEYHDTLLILNLLPSTTHANFSALISLARKRYRFWARENSL
jgi:hypothetical protein